VRVPGRVFVLVRPDGGAVRVRLELETGERREFPTVETPAGLRVIAEQHLESVSAGRVPPRWWG
jgi:hypothetical protein